MYVEHICRIILYSCTLLKIKDLLCNSFNILISLLFMYVNYFIYIYLEVNIYIQSTRITLPLWTFAMLPAASTSNPPRIQATLASPQPQAPHNAKKQHQHISASIALYLLILLIRLFNLITIPLFFSFP